MRIATTYSNGELFRRFGQTPHFKFYDINNGRIYLVQIIDTPPKKGHTALAAFLKKFTPDVLICGNLGEGAQDALKTAGIEIYPGISGNADEAVKAFFAGTLPKNEFARCDHHDHEGHKSH